MATKKLTSPDVRRNSPRPAGLATPIRSVVPASLDLFVPTLRKAKSLLEEGRAREAFDLLKPATTDPVVKNARGVCLLRLGELAGALRVFREICLMPGGVSLRTDVPTVWKTNFATTLLLQGNISGAMSILNEIGDADHSEVPRLRAAIQRWVSGLSWWQRLNWRLGQPPQRPVVLDFLPGQLQ